VVDATEMPADFREDFFMTSRDRAVDTEDREFVDNEIKEFLKGHEGLRQLNNKRKEEAITKTVASDEPLDILQELINDDPTLASLFGLGDRLRIPYGKEKAVAVYHGQRFPTFFRLKKENMVKDCPINRSCRVEFETDAADDYFSRGDEPGDFDVIPPSFNQGYKLYHGICSAKFCPPINCEVGDLINIEVTVSDPSRETAPFVCKFKIRVTAKDITPEPEPNPNPRPPKPEASGGVNMPVLHEIGRENWPAFKFDEHSGLSFSGGFDGEPLEAYVNMENIFLTNELARAKDDGERVLLRHYYKYGSVLVALGLLQEAKRRKALPEDGNGPKKNEDQLTDDFTAISRLSGGIAAVIIPVVRNLAATAARARA